MHSRDSFTATLPFLFNKTHSTEFLFWVCVVCFLLSLDSIRALATSLPHRRTGRACGRCARQGPSPRLSWLPVLHRTRPWTRTTLPGPKRAAELGTFLGNLSQLQGRAFCIRTDLPGRRVRVWRKTLHCVGRASGQASQDTPSSTQVHPRARRL